MKILVFANDLAWNELTNGSVDIEWTRAANLNSFTNTDDADAYFNLYEDADKTNYSSFKKMLFLLMLF